MSWPRWIDESRMLREVAPGLHIGDQRAINSDSWSLVIDMHGANSDVDKLNLPMQDGTRVPRRYLDQASTALREAQGAVLVTCEQGRSRSACMAYALLRTQHLLKHDEALERVSSVVDTLIPGIGGVTFPRGKILDSVVECFGRYFRLIDVKDVFMRWPIVGAGTFRAVLGYSDELVAKVPLSSEGAQHNRSEALRYQAETHKELLAACSLGFLRGYEVLFMERVKPEPGLRPYKTSDRAQFGTTSRGDIVRYDYA